MKTYPLKRCPFCGEKAKITTYDFHGEEFYAIGCGTRGCLMRRNSSYLGVKQEELAKAWNRRKDVNS